MSRRYPVLLILALVLAACLPAPVEPGAQPTQPPIVIPTHTAPPTPAQAALTPAQQAALDTLLAERGLTAAQVELVSTDAVEWFDSCLGIVRPDALCAPGPVPGFSLVFAVGDELVEVHTDQDGTAVAIVEPAPASRRVAVFIPDGSLQIVDTALASDPANPPADNGFLPRGGLAGQTVFALPYSGPAQAVAVDPANPTYPPAVHSLDFIERPNYGLAVWPGDAGSGPALAWGTQIEAESGQTTLLTAAPDGSQLATLVAEDGNAPMPHELVAQRWANGGRALYFSREPVGIGGYILFAGASSLYRLDLDTQAVTDLIPFDFASGQGICLDAMSPDERYVADHCAATAITVRDLQTGTSVTLETPAELTEFGLVGSARFSPDGGRVAYALAVSNPEAEQGWLAVSDGLDGPSMVIATSEPGQYFTVAAWLDSDTVLAQVNDVSCNPECVNELWTVSVVNGTAQKVAEGVFAALVGG